MKNNWIRNQWQARSESIKSTMPYLPSYPSLTVDEIMHWTSFLTLALSPLINFSPPSLQWKILTLPTHTINAIPIMLPLTWPQLSITWPTAADPPTELSTASCLRPSSRSPGHLALLFLLDSVRRRFLSRRFFCPTSRCDVVLLLLLRCSTFLFFPFLLALLFLVVGWWLSEFVH